MELKRAEACTPIYLNGALKFFVRKTMNLIIARSGCLQKQYLKIVSMVCGAASLFAASAAEPDLRRDATVEAIRRVMPSVVNIRTETMVESRDFYDDFFRNFFGTYCINKAGQWYNYTRYSISDWLLQ